MRQCFKQKCLRIKGTAMTTSSSGVVCSVKVDLFILTECPMHLYTTKTLLFSLNQFPSLTSWQNVASIILAQTQSLSAIFPDTTRSSKPLPSLEVIIPSSKIIQHFLCAPTAIFTNTKVW